LSECISLIRCRDEAVEVIRTIATADYVYETVYEFGKKLGKTPVRTSDKTGFIVNRLLVPYLLMRFGRTRKA